LAWKNAFYNSLQIISMKYAIQLVLLSFLLCVSGGVFGQQVSIGEIADSTQTYKVELVDGTVFIGTILNQDSLNIVMRTASIPRIEISIAQIKSLELVDKSSIRNGKYWFPNPHATRYLYAPSAINLQRGEGYYQNTWLILNSFNVGVTDNFSIGGGLELISTFAERNPIFFVTPKVGFKLAEKFHAGGGVLFASIPSFGSSNRSYLGTTFVSGTYGSKDRNITSSLGWGFVEGELSRRPIITLSAMTRVSRRTALVSENWFIPIDGYYGLLSYGVRFFGEKIAVDLAFINNRDIFQSIFIGIPYVSFTVKF
jgi:hypothetical protein